MLLAHVQALLRTGRLLREIREAEEKGALVVCDVLLPHKDGTLRSTNVSFSVMTMGEHTYVLASARDETERQAMGHRLAQSSRMASVGMLAAGVAHELNNPLAWVLYNLQATIEDLEQHAGALEPALRSRLDPSGATCGQPKRARSACAASSPICRPSRA